MKTTGSNSGGVAFVTTVLLPAVKRFREPAERIEFFERVEAGFARQARVTTLVTGFSLITVGAAVAGSHGWMYGQ